METDVRAGVLEPGKQSDSGMVAPGIRHNAECKRKRAAFEAENVHEVPEGVPESRPRMSVQFGDMEVDEAPAPAGVGSGEVEMHVEGSGVEDQGVKREADQSVEDLEAEMNEERASGRPMTLDLFLADNACDSLGPVEWLIEHGPERTAVTGPDLYDVELNSIKFTQDASLGLPSVSMWNTVLVGWGGWATWLLHGMDHAMVNRQWVKVN
eukprot:s367_g16.t1